MMDNPSLTNEKKETENPSLNKTNKKKNGSNTKRIKNKNMLSVFLTLLAIISPVKSQFNISRFENKAGIFFEKVATVGLTKTSWNIVVHINISEYTAAMTSLDKAMLSIAKLKVKGAGYESSSEQNLQAIYERILNRHEMIMSSTPQRRKRSLLPFVGGIYHSLFGLMDEDHAEKITEKLKQNNQREEYLLNAIRNLSSVQDMTMEIIRNQNKAVFKNIQIISGAIQLLEEESYETKNESARLRAVSNILTSLEVYEKIQDDIIGAMFNAKGSFLHGILPVRKFKKQIEVIKANLKINIRLPSEEPVALAKIAKISTRTTNEFVLFNIQIPLINNEVLQAYEIYTYPTVHDGFSISIHANNRYFLID